MPDEQDAAEDLDEDALDLGDDPTGDLAFPPEHLRGANQYGLTAAEEMVGEPVSERSRREEPEQGYRTWSDRRAPAGRLVEPGSIESGVPSDPDDDEFTAEAFDADDLSAEEAAVHIIENP
jgi:hypothetical protein